VVSFTINPYSILMPAIAVETFGKGAELHGLFVSAVGIGALTGTIMLASRPGVRGLSRWIVATAALASFGAISFSLLAPFKITWLSMLAMACVGMGLMGTSASVNTIIQSVVEDDKRGRVVSVYSTFFTGAVRSSTSAQAGWRSRSARRIPIVCIVCAVHQIGLHQKHSGYTCATFISSGDHSPPEHRRK
jgi:MFS family permease